MHRAINLELKMNLHRFLIRPYFYTRYGFHRLTGTGAFKPGRGRPVQTMVTPQSPPLKRALWNHFVKQFHASSCSVATVVSCVNAIRTLRNGNIRPISQFEILDRVTTGHWKERMGDNGYRGRRGLPLPLLGQVVIDSLAAYGLDVQAVDIVRTPKNESPQATIRLTLKKRLRELDRIGNSLIIAHFDQGAFVPTLNIPHISPVGAYDCKTDLVTVLDVDPEIEEPYQVDFNTFYKGLSADYHQVLKAYGYGSGGYVYIKI